MADLRGIGNKLAGGGLPLALPVSKPTRAPGGPREALEDGSQIDMEKIKMIESSGNPKAFNKVSQARGLYQITPIALQEWNNYHKREQYTENELFNAKINTKIGHWYMKERIPQLLKHYKIPDTIENRIKAYNWGIGAMQEDVPVPEETLNYIKKYRGE